MSIRANTVCAGIFSNCMVYLGRKMSVNTELKFITVLEVLSMLSFKLDLTHDSEDEFIGVAGNRRVFHW